MSPALTLVIIVAVAYLATHLAYDWLARRLTIVSGAEYLTLGVLLGPQVSGVFSAGVVDSLAPLTTLALGWVGAIVGMQFHLPSLVRVRGLFYRLAFAEAFATLAAVTVVEVVVLERVLGLARPLALGAAIALGAIACASAPAAVALGARAVRGRALVVRQLEIATAVDALVAIAAFGLLLCVAHTAPVRTARAPTATEWAVIHLGVGAIAGALFHLFIGDETKIDRLVISLLGAIVLASGAAAYLDLSPLLATMIVGILLVNTSRNREEISAVLARAERPFYYVLLVFAGAAWRPSGQAAWPVAVVVFLVVRAAAKVGSARLATHLAGATPIVGGHWGRALIGQGGLAVAIALDFLRRDAPPVPNVVFTAAAASVLLTDLSAARVVRSVLRPLLDPFQPPDGRPIASIGAANGPPAPGEPPLPAASAARED